ncbi:MAG: hypothetical protein LUH22_12855, partial [Bacteroides sp.]|nr:hypothetical protein [Bacteroides sp.]
TYYAILFIVLLYRTHVKLSIQINGQELTADLIESQTSKEFMALLPLTFNMTDYNTREKYADLEQPISANENVSEDYETGYLYYWTGGGIVVFYRHDGKKLQGGAVKLAKINNGLDLFREGDTVEVTFELLPV